MALIALSLSPLAALAGVVDVANVAVYDEGRFASAGQPEPAQYADIAAAGYERVIYLAYSDQPPHEEANDRLAHAAGLDYVHIPVRFDEPRYADFAGFAALLEAEPRPTFVHCQVNFRASVFSFLYRVIHDDVSVADAKRDLDAIWRPDAVWQAFMRDALERHGLSMDCPDCDWQIDEDG